MVNKDYRPRLDKLEQVVKELRCLADGGHFWYQGYKGGTSYLCSHCNASYTDKKHWERNAIFIGTAVELQSYIDSNKENKNA